MKTIKITSVESLHYIIGEIVHRRISLTKATATRDAEIAELTKRYETSIQNLQEQIAEMEEQVLAYCTANRSELFGSRKSASVTLADFGFELTPWRVTKARKLKWSDVVERLKRSIWGRVYVAQKESVDKNALLSEREGLTPEMLTAAGIGFARDEQFFIRPKPETADASVVQKEAA